MEYIAVVNKDTKSCGCIVRKEDAANRVIEKRRKHYPNDKDAELVLVHGGAPYLAFTDRDKCGITAAAEDSSFFPLGRDGPNTRTKWRLSCIVSYKIIKEMRGDGSIYEKRGRIDQFSGICQA